MHYIKVVQKPLRVPALASAIDASRWIFVKACFISSRECVDDVIFASHRAAPSVQMSLDCFSVWFDLLHYMIQSRVHCRRDQHENGP